MIPEHLLPYDFTAMLKGAIGEISIGSSFLYLRSIAIVSGEISPIVFFSALINAAMKTDTEMSFHRDHVVTILK